jgi:DNA-binding Lrp family transcriptional regulator
MKDITPRLIELLKTGYCTPLISQIAKKLKEPSTTIHYNIKKLEKEKAIKSYRAVFDYKKIGKGHCVYVLANLKEEKYGYPEEAIKVIAEDPRIESVDIVTGDYEVIMKLRVKDIDDYYTFVKEAVKKYGFSKMVSLTSLKQIKSEFVKLE